LVQQHALIGVGLGVARQGQYAAIGGRQMRACKKCGVEMSRREVDPTCSAARVEPRPIVLQLKAKPFMLIGRAPGLTEYLLGKPFSGQAGMDIRRPFADCGCGPADFERLVHSSAVAKC
jgi:uracil-DNA glycosylase